MRGRTVFMAAAVAAVVAGLVVGGTAVGQAAVSTQAAVAGGAPYIYPATGGRDPVSTMSRTGVKAFTLAFILSKGTCNPTWDGTGALNGAAINNQINNIRRAGGDVVVSFGGFSGPKLATHCANETALAAAYQKVIDAYKLKVIDLDLEKGNNSSENEVAQSQKVLKALKIVKQKNPGIRTIVTLGVGTNGLEGPEAAVPGQAVSLKAPIDVWTIMPFDFGIGGKPDMGKLSLQASEGLHRQLKSAYKTKSDAEIYAMQGISSMNGKTDVAGENVTVANFKTMLQYCQQHHLARFTYWELNRDNSNLDYTKVIGQFTG